MDFGAGIWKAEWLSMLHCVKLCTLGITFGNKIFKATYRKHESWQSVRHMQEDNSIIIGHIIKPVYSFVGRSSRISLLIVRNNTVKVILKINCKKYLNKFNCWQTAHEQKKSKIVSPSSHLILIWKTVADTEVATVVFLDLDQLQRPSASILEVLCNMFRPWSFNRNLSQHTCMSGTYNSTQNMERVQKVTRKTHPNLSLWDWTCLRHVLSMSDTL